MTIFYISDTHFGHANILTFTRAAPSVSGVIQESSVRVRPEFSSADEMDEHLIERWNAVVRPEDHVWHLGDVSMARGNDIGRIDKVMQRLQGHKRLVLGNHDHLNPRWYVRWFEKIRGSQMHDGLLFTHIPVAPWSFGKAKANVHGHVHANQPRVWRPASTGRTYVNLSVEVNAYTPVSLETIQSWLTP